jgi:hypothetical protein
VLRPGAPHSSPSVLATEASRSRCARPEGLARSMVLLHCPAHETPRREYRRASLRPSARGWGRAIAFFPPLQLSPSGHD